MHLHDQGGLTPQQEHVLGPPCVTAELEFNAQLARTVFTIRDAIGVDRRTFMDMLGMTASRYGQVLARNDSFSPHELQSLAEAVDIDLDLIFSGGVDYAALSRRFRGDHKTLPERYLDPKKQLGRARAVQVILAHLSTYHGEEYARAILRRYQLYPETFSDSNSFIDPRITFDLLQNLYNEGYSESLIESIGTMTLVVNQATIGKRLSSFDTPRQLYTYIHEELLSCHYDRVAEYALEKLTDEGCVTSSRPRQAAQDVFRTKLIDNRCTCLYRMGVHKSFLAAIRPYYATARKLSCIHNGDNACRVELRWH